MQAQLAGALEDAEGVGGKDELRAVDVDAGLAEGLDDEVKERWAQGGIQLIGHQDPAATQSIENQGSGGHPVLRAAGFIGQLQLVEGIIGLVLHDDGVQQGFNLRIGVGAKLIGVADAAIAAAERIDDRAHLAEDVLRDVVLVEPHGVDTGIGRAQQRGGLMQVQLASADEGGDACGRADGGVPVRQVGHVVHQGTGQRREDRVAIAQAGGEDQLGVRNGAELGDVPLVHEGFRPLYLLTAGPHEAGAPPCRWHAAEPFRVHAGEAPLESVEVAHAIELKIQLESAGQALRAGI